MQHFNSLISYFLLFYFGWELSKWHFSIIFFHNFRMRISEFQQYMRFVFLFSFYVNNAISNLVFNSIWGLKEHHLVTYFEMDQSYLLLLNNYRCSYRTLWMLSLVNFPGCKLFFLYVSWIRWISTRQVIILSMNECSDGYHIILYLDKHCAVLFYKSWQDSLRLTG